MLIVLYNDLEGVENAMIVLSLELWHYDICILVSNSQDKQY